MLQMLRATHCLDSSTAAARKRLRLETAVAPEAGRRTVGQAPSAVQATAHCQQTARLLDSFPHLEQVANVIPRHAISTLRFESLGSSPEGKRQVLCLLPSHAAAIEHHRIGGTMPQGSAQQAVGKRVSKATGSRMALRMAETSVVGGLRAWGTRVAHYRRNGLALVPLSRRLRTAVHGSADAVVLPWSVQRGRVTSR